MNLDSSCSPRGIPVRRFTTDDFLPSERHEAWRTQGWPSVAQICDFRADADFFAHTATVAVGTVQMIAGDYAAQDVHRSARSIRREPIDHLHITIPTGGEVKTQRGVAGPGTAVVIDLAQEWRHHADAGAMTTIVVPRPVAADAGIDPSHVHGIIVPAEEAVLFREHAKQVINHVGIVPHFDPNRVARSLVDLLAVSLSIRHGGITPTIASRSVAIKAALNRIIATNLHYDGLTVDFVLAQSKVSRSTAYRLFEDEGGIYQEILRQRLAAAKDVLALTDDKVFDIAHRFCFSGSAHFARLFRQHFAVTPTDWRSASRDGAAN